MTVVAVMTNGDEVALDPSCGTTPEEVVEKLVAETLTGSAAPFADVWLDTVNDGKLRYGNVVRLKTQEF